MIGRFPFSGNDPKEMLQSIGRYTIFADPKCRKFSKDTFDFLKNLLAEDVSERPSAAEMIDHPFIQCVSLFRRLHASTCIALGFLCAAASIENGLHVRHVIYI